MTFFEFTHQQIFNKYLITAAGGEVLSPSAFFIERNKMDNTPEKQFEEFRINMIIQKPMVGCMGPIYNPYAADEAYERVLKLLQVDYRILDNDFNKNDKLRAEYRANLKHAIHELFKLDCWEGF